MMKTYEERFAYNLHRLRSAAGLTQKQLGQSIGYSEKTVSKWERAASVPAIDALYGIAAKLHVTLDELFREDRLYYLGIDGGGTKTQLTLTDEELNIVSEVRCDCCNPIDIGIDAAESLLRDAIYKVCGNIPMSSISMFAGIAGGTSSDMKPELERFFGEFGFAAYKNDSDNQNILAAGLDGGDGVTLIMGTGICAFSQKSGKQTRVGGWGYLFDDGGSGYNLGRDALALHFRVVDGSSSAFEADPMLTPELEIGSDAVDPAKNQSGKRSILSELIAADNPDSQELLGRLYKGGKKVIAGYSHYVFKAAQAGDLGAHYIIKRNMHCAAGIIKTAAAGLEADRIPIILAGGITEQPLAFEYLKKALDDPRLELRLLGCEPVMGAVKLAKQLMRKN